MDRNTTWKEICIEFKKYADSFSKNNFFIEKKTVVETISVTINDSSDVLCVYLYLINIFAKSTVAERCTGVMLKLTLYCLSVTVEDLDL